ncbi:MAG: penicillin-binding transpeptidase domain-containing protein, partial [Oscillospiraceae bacterium]
EKIIARGKKTNSYYEVIGQRVEEDVKNQITQFTLDNKINCVNLIESTRRYYPYGSLASTVLGFTDNDSKGAYGLESYYNRILAGTPGMVVSAKNAKGGTMNGLSYDKMYEPVDGNSLVLTIDEVVQHSLEKHLEAAVIEHHVQNRAVGIAMDPKTGAILGMATKGDFDPNQPSVLTEPKAIARIAELENDPALRERLAAIADPAERQKALDAARQEAQQQEWYDQWRNKAICDPYEPGSVFKIITASMALDTQSVATSGQYFTCPGYHMVAGRRKACWKTAGHGTIDFVQAVKFSCNPAFMMIGALIGAERFDDYFDRFGLSEPTGIDLPGEADGLYYADLPGLSKQSEEYLASCSFGQTFKVTPIQIITAVSAAINGGKLMQPYVVSQVLDPLGNVVSTTEPVMRRQVISEATSKTMAGILERVVKDPDGSGKNAYLPGYRVGGKTGTSQKLDRTGEKAEYVASFIGMAPCDDPKIVVLVMLDEPQMQNVYGSVIAAPVVGAIMADVLPYLGVEPIYTEAEQARLEIEVPGVTGKIMHDAISDLSVRGLGYKTIGAGVTVVRQLPAKGEVMPRGGTVILYTDEAKAAAQIVVPNVLGLSGQQANRTILNAGLNIKLTGCKIENSNAVAIAQNPAEGTPVEAGTVVTVEFADRGAPDVAKR